MPEPPSVALKVRGAVVARVKGATVLTVKAVGATVSTSQVHDAVPVLPTSSVALTTTVCDPLARPDQEAGHGPVAPASSWQVTVSAALGRPGSLAVHVTDAFVMRVGLAGLLPSTTTGASASGA